MSDAERSGFQERPKSRWEACGYVRFSKSGRTINISIRKDEWENYIVNPEDLQLLLSHEIDRATIRRLVR